MNPRERILCALSHREPDRVPVDLGSSTVTGIAATAYNSLKKRLGISSPTMVYDVVQQLANIDTEVIDRFGVDALDINRFSVGGADWHEVTLHDGSRAWYPGWFRPIDSGDGSSYTSDSEGQIISKRAAGAAFYDQACFPWESGYPDDLGEISQAMKKISWVVHSHASNLDTGSLRKAMADEKEKSGRALVMSGGVKLLETGFFLRRMDNLLTDLLTDEVKVAELFDRLTEIHLEGLARKIESAGDLADVIRFGDDLGMTTGPLMDSDTFRRLLKPRYRILCDFVKSKSKLKIFFHSCGSIRQFIPDLIDVGIDIINPVQTNCFDMDPAELKREFGKDIVFWGGGVDTQSVINRGTPREVRDDVLRRCGIMAKNGGFVFAPVHNLLSEVPPENIIAAYDAVKEFNGD